MKVRIEVDSVEVVRDKWGKVEVVFSRETAEQVAKQLADNCIQPAVEVEADTYECSAKPRIDLRTHEDIKPPVAKIDVAAAATRLRETTDLLRQSQKAERGESSQTQDTSSGEVEVDTDECPPKAERLVIPKTCKSCGWCLPNGVCLLPASSCSEEPEYRRQHSGDKKNQT